MPPPKVETMTPSFLNTNRLTSASLAGGDWPRSLANGRPPPHIRRGGEPRSKEFLKVAGKTVARQSRRALQKAQTRTAPPRVCTMSATHFNRGPAYGMSAEVKSKVKATARAVLGGPVCFFI